MRPVVIHDSTSWELKLHAFAFVLHSAYSLLELFIEDPNNEKGPRTFKSKGLFVIGCLAVTYSRMGAPTLPSALTRFTSEFEMESGGSTLPLPPSKFSSMLEN